MKRAPVPYSWQRQWWSGNKRMDRRTDIQTLPNAVVKSTKLANCTDAGGGSDDDDDELTIIDVCLCTSSSHAQLSDTSLQNRVPRPCCSADRLLHAVTFRSIPSVLGESRYGRRWWRWAGIDEIDGQATLRLVEGYLETKINNKNWSSV